MVSLSISGTTLSIEELNDRVLHEGEIITVCLSVPGKEAPPEIGIASKVFHVGWGRGTLTNNVTLETVGATLVGANNPKQQRDGAGFEHTLHIEAKEGRICTSAFVISTMAGTIRMLSPFI